MKSVQPFRASCPTALALLLSLQAGACSNHDSPPMLGTTPDAADPLPYYEDTRTAPPNDLSWSQCDLDTETGVAKGVAECATIEVPVRRNVAGTSSIKLSVKRYRPVANPRGQLWLINGGPGAPTGAFESSLSLFTAVGKDLEIYLLDHRGTGKSGRLVCPEQEASSSNAGTAIEGSEWQACATATQKSLGDDLSGFNVTEAAADLGEAISRTRHQTEDVFLYSVSYGTYLAQRYLQLYPEQATGIVLDSICSPGECKLLLGYDRAFDQTARDVFALCAADNGCRSQLGDAPYERLRALESALDNQHCKELGWSRATLRQVMGFMVMYIGLRDYMPAVVARVERCSANDVTSLQNFERVLSSIGTEEAGFSQVLGANIALSELSERPLPSAAEVQTNVSTLAASLDAGPPMAGAIGAWPTYTPDEYVGKFASTSIPLLMLNGTLDPQTPLSVATPTGEHFTGAHQQFIRIPNAAHTTLTQSPVNEENDTCGAELIRQFFDNPTATLDESCLAYVLPIDFSGNAELTRALFGTSTPWADEVPKAATRFTGQRGSPVQATLRRTRPHWAR